MRSSSGAVLHLSHWSSALLADSVNDPESTRKVYLIAAGLTLLGLILIAITVWFWRNTRHDPELLGPLEAMGDRKFARLDTRSRQQMLDDMRPSAAQTLRGGTDVAPAPAEPIDLRRAKSSVAAGYDDLRDDAAPAPAGPETLGPVDAETVRAADAPGTVSPGPGAEIVDPETGVAEPGADAAVADEAVADAAAAADAAPADADQPAADGAPDPTAETERDEFAVLDAMPTTKPDAMRDPDTEVAPADPAANPPAPVPLVIVPMDHDLPSAEPVRSSAPRRSANGAEAAPLSPSTQTPAADDASSIDPLLRRRDRDDG